MTLRSMYWRLKHYVHEHPWLFPALQRLRGADYGTFCGSQADFCIEGFQSSANSFAYNIFRILRPDLDIAHHTHSVANVKRALSHEVPTLILCRDPVEAVPSMVARFHPSLEAAVYRYRRFYRFVLAHSSQLIVATFPEVTGPFENTVRRVERNTQLSFGDFDPEDVRRRTIEHIREWSSERGKEEQMSLPRDEREAEKERLRRRLKSLPQFRTAAETYRQLEALAGSEPTSAETL